MATPTYLSQNFSTTLNVSGGINNSQTTGIILTSVSGLDTSGGVLCLNWSSSLDTAVAEYIEYTGITSNELTGVTRGVEGSSAKAHSNGATVVAIVSQDHVNRLADKLRSVDTTLVQDVNANEIIKTTYVASAVNEVTFSNSATGNKVVQSLTGGDTNISGQLKAKGSGTWQKPTSCSIQVVSGATALSTGDGKFYFTIPPELDGMVLSRVHARVVTAGTTNTTDIQLHNVTDAVDILSTKLTIDSGETGSDTAAAAAVINTSNDDLATNDLIRIDIDAVSTTPPNGLILNLGFNFA